MEKINSLAKLVFCRRLRAVGLDEMFPLFTGKNKVSGYLSYSQVYTGFNLPVVIIHRVSRATRSEDEVFMTRQLKE